MVPTIGDDRPTKTLISLSNLKNNVDIVKTFISNDVKIMGIVKANAYGHGILKISKELIKNGVNYLGVAFLEEGIYLRNSGIDIPILVMGAINVNQISDFIRYNIDLTTSSIDKSKAISVAAAKIGKKAVVHIKIDTGMERIGVQWYNAEKFINKSFALPYIEVKGVFSHLAKSESDKDFSYEQIKRFDKIIGYMEKKHIKPPLIHLANSEAIVNYKESHYNMVRPGLMLYGYSSSKNIQNRLKPVMTLITKVGYFKVVDKDIGISYGHTYKTKEMTRIITLPIGYGDGYTRLLSNKASVIIRGTKYPLVGNICMDQMMVDIGKDGTAYNGDTVLLFGEFEGSKLSLLDLCKQSGMIPYELLCMISSRVPRIYIS